jgi:hypothetical protein
MQAAARQAARDELLGHSSPYEAPQSQGLFSMTATAGQQAANANRVRAEGRAWRAQAAFRESRRQQMVAATTGGEIGAAERALRTIARNNGFGGAAP